MLAKLLKFLLILFESLNTCIISYHQHVIGLASVRKKVAKRLSKLCKYWKGICCRLNAHASDCYRSLVSRDRLVEISERGCSFLAHATSLWLVAWGLCHSYSGARSVVSSHIKKKGLTESAVETNVSCYKRYTKFIPKQVHVHARYASHLCGGRNECCKKK